MRGKGSGGQAGKRGRGRWKRRAAAADVASYKWVAIGVKVEVRSDEDGFVGAWFVAQVVHLESPSSCVVEYEQLLADDASSPLQELVFLHNVRPCPPPLPPCCSWLQGHFVEAYDHDGWWAGVVVRSLPDLDLVLVRFRTTGEELSFPPSLLRGLQNWDDGKWTDLTQVGRPDNYHVANAADANGSSSPLHTLEMRKSYTDLPSLSPKEVSQEIESEEYDDVESIQESPLKDLNPRKKFSGYELCDKEISQVLRTNGYLATELPKNKIRLELVAYQLLVEALRLKGPLKWEHERLLSDVRLHLRITSEEQLLCSRGYAC